MKLIAILFSFSLPFLMHAQTFDDEVLEVFMNAEITSYDELADAPICHITITIFLDENHTIANVNLSIGNADNEVAYFSDIYNFTSLSNDSNLSNVSITDNEIEFTIQNVILPPDYQAIAVFDDGTGNFTSTISIL